MDASKKYERLFWEDGVMMSRSAHTLIAGTTGSGKSVALNSILVNTLLDDRRNLYAFIDLKRVELADYKALPNCIGYAVYEDEAIRLLDSVIYRMETRFENMVGKETFEPDVYVVIDELADLVENKGVLERLIKIGRLGRAAHIHLIAASQDPSRRTLKAQLVQNFTCRLALRCISSIESRQVLGISGAELLTGHGKGILRDPNGIRNIRIPKTDDEDILDVINYRKDSTYLKSVEIPIFRRAS